MRVADLGANRIGDRPACPSQMGDLLGNLVVGANIAGFVKVADAMLDQGVV